MEIQGISKLELKNQNRKYILNEIRENKNISRVDIAQKNTLTKATITIITNEMIQNKVLIEQDFPLQERSHARGRKKVALAINYDYKYVIGISFFSRQICLAITNLEEKCLYSEVREINVDMSLSEISEVITDTVKKALKKTNLPKNRILGIGICYSVCVYERLINSESSPELFAKQLEKQTDITVIHDTFSKQLALSHISHNSTGHNENIMILYLGNHITCTIINHQKLVTNTFEKTLEIEELLLPTSITNTEEPQKVKELLTRVSIEEELQKLATPENAPILYERFAQGKKLKSEHLLQSYHAKEPLIREMFEKKMREFAMVLNNYSCLYLSDTIYVYCEFFGNEFYQVLQKALEEYHIDIINRIKKSKISAKENYLAGVTLAINQLFYETGGTL